MLKQALVVLLVFATNQANAQLDQQQFIEAVGVLGLSPDAMAASGVSDQDLIDAYAELAEDEKNWWNQYAGLRDSLRGALDNLGTSSDGEQVRQQVDLADNALDQAVSAWRNELLVSVDEAESARLSILWAQSNLDVPVAMKVHDWTEDEETELQRGYRQYLRNQRFNETSESQALTFYTASLAQSDVVVAQANWDARHTLYTQRFAETLAALN